MEMMNKGTKTQDIRMIERIGVRHFLVDCTGINFTRTYIVSA